MFPYGTIGGIKNGIHNQTILERLTWCFTTRYTLHEVLHLLMIPIDARLVWQRENPSAVRLGLFQQVAAGPAYKGIDGGRARHISENTAFGAIDLIAQVERATCSPTEFALGKRPILKAQQCDGIVVARGLVAVYHRITPGKYLDRFNAFAYEIASSLDSMTTHVEECATSRLVHIPEMRCMRTSMSLA